MCLHCASTAVIVVIVEFPLYYCCDIILLVFLSLPLLTFCHSIAVIVIIDVVTIVGYSLIQAIVSNHVTCCKILRMYHQ